MGAAMTWRDKYEVHPFADMFPMMSDEELATLGADIQANGLRELVAFCWVETGTLGSHRVLVDGRNRMEAMERIGINLQPRSDGLPKLGGRHYATALSKDLRGVDPVAYILGLNVHRRHLSVQQQADLIVAAHLPKPGQPGPVSAEAHKGGRGKVNELKAKAIATAKAMLDGPSERTIKRSVAKVSPQKPKPVETAEADGKTPAKPVATVEDAGIIEDDDPNPTADETEPLMRRRALLAFCHGEELKDASRHVEWFEQHPEEIDDELYSAVFRVGLAWHAHPRALHDAHDAHRRLVLKRDRKRLPKLEVLSGEDAA
jgi:hypothetical protein